MLAGIDYQKIDQPEDIQVKNLKWCIALAKELGRPLVLHARSDGARNAYSKCMDVLLELGPEASLHIHWHWFGGTKDDLIRILLKYKEKVKLKGGTVNL